MICFVVFMWTFTYPSPNPKLCRGRKYPQKMKITLRIRIDSLYYQFLHKPIGISICAILVELRVSRVPMSESRHMVNQWTSVSAKDPAANHEM